MAVETGRKEIQQGSAMAPSEDLTLSETNHLAKILGGLAEQGEVGSPESEAGAASCLLGTCVEDRHATLKGRIRVRWSRPGGGEGEEWLPILQSLSIRRGDRVLIQSVENWPEPVVTGVVDGYATRPEPEVRSAGGLELKPDEALEIRGPDGEPLLELRPGQHGPVLRVVSQDLDIDVPGRLRLRAGILELLARKGSVQIEAGDDVIVKGEVIKLN